MKIPAGKKYSVDVRRIRGGGHPYIVRVYRNGLFCRCPLTNDWFLNEQQANEFAESAAAELSSGGDINTIRQRPPGWRFKRPPH